MSAPGWYPDPAGKSQQRYWNGSTWTDHIQAYSAPLPHPPGHNDTSALPIPGDASTPAWSSAAPPPRTWYQRKAIVIPLGVLALFVAIGVIGAIAGSPKKQNAGNSVPLTASTTSQSSAATVSPPTSSVPPPTSIEPSSPAPTTSSVAAPQTPTDDGSFTMPSEVGKNLQDAQDDIQRVSGDPVFFSHSHDLLSQRFQILDRDWKVCTQNVAPGTKASAIQHIDFGVVKLSEACP